MSYPYINAYQQFFDTSGAPLVNGTIEFRSPTTNDLINTYPTADNADAQTDANDNPLTLNAAGAAPAGLFLEDGVSYKVILKNADGGTEATHDDVKCPKDNYPITDAEQDAGVTVVNFEYPPGNVLRYGTNTTPGTTDMAAAIQAAFDSVTQNEAVIFGPKIDGVMEQCYYISSSSTMTGKNDIIVIGNNATIKESSGTLTEHLLFTTCDRLTINDLSFLAGEDEAYFNANTPSEERQFIDLDDCDDVTITNINGRNKRRLLTALDCNRITVDGFSMQGFLPAASSPNANANHCQTVSYRNCDYSTISNGRVRNMGSCYLQQQSGAHVAVSNIVGEELHDNGVYISSGFEVSITNCTFENIQGDGVQLRGSNMSVSNCTVKNADDVGVALTGLTFVGADAFGAAGSGYSITGNTIDGCERGINVTTDDTLYPRDITISGNTITNCTEVADIGAITIGTDIGGVTIIGNTIRTAACDEGIFIANVATGTTPSGFIINSNIISDINGASAATRGGIRVDNADDVSICNNVFQDINSTLGVRLNTVDGGVVANNIYEGNQVVRAPAGESNQNIVFVGNRGSALVVDGDNNTVLQNDAAVSGYPAASTTPRTVGQVTYDSGLYIAKGIASAADWYGPILSPNVIETVNQPWTFSNASGWLAISATLPELRMEETDQAVGEKGWILAVSSSSFFVRAYSDDWQSSNDAITIKRTGYVIDSVQFGSCITVPDGTTAPSAITGAAAIYVDAADGDLKVKFADGHVAVIAADS